MTDFRGVRGAGDFWFLRHGESAGNRTGAMMGREDSPLSEAGREQARAAAAWLRAHGPASGERPPFARVLTSPLSRARDTAAVLAAGLGGVPVEVREELNELDIGLFTGLTAAEARARHPAEWAVFQAQSWEGVPGAERVDGLLARVGRLWALLLERAGAGEGPALAVTHSGILQWILKSTFGQREWMPIVPMGNCGVSRFRIRNHLAGEPPGWYWEWALINRPTLADGGA